MAATDIGIEQMGGFAGAGGPGSRVHTRAEAKLADLSPADRAMIDAAFAHKHTPVSANLYYRMTRTGPGGSETVDVLTEQVPGVLIARLSTTLD